MTDKVINLRELDYTIIGLGTVLQGDLFFPHSVQVFGDLRGNITVGDGAHLVFHKGSKAEGNIKAKSLDIFGHTEGQIECTELVIFHPGSFHTGPISAKNIKIYPGAIVESEIITKH